MSQRDVDVLHEECTRRGVLLSELAVELAVGSETRAEADVGATAAAALMYLVNAVVQVAALNSAPREVIERVVSLLDTADVEKVRAARIQRGEI